MGNKVLFEFLGQISLSLIQILIPAIIILVLIIIFYALLQAISAKIMEESKQNFWKLWAGGFSKSITFLIEKLPSILMLLAVVTGLSLLVNVGTQIYEINENQKRIKELTTFVKNLSQNDKIAHITVKEKILKYPFEYGIYKIDIYDSITGDIIFENDYTVQGRDLRIDSMVINFEYSEIGAGTQKNLSFPYRLFSNKIPAENGIQLETFFTSPNSETIIENEEEVMLGLSRETFKQRAKEFVEIINDPIQRQELGIRSSYGNTITIPMTAKAGEEYAIYIEGTGGLSCKLLNIDSN